MTESNILEVFDRRIRATPSGLVVYEHEVRKFIDALRDMSFGGVMDDLALEEHIRSGFARYRGLPVRVK